MPPRVHIIGSEPLELEQREMLSGNPLPIAMAAQSVQNDIHATLDAPPSFSWPGQPTMEGALAEIDLHPGLVTYDTALSPDGRTIATSGPDKTIRLWNADTSAPLLTLPGHTNIVVQIAFSPDGNTIASASYDRTVRLWDAHTGAALHTIPLPSLGVVLDFSPDGKTLAIGIHEQALGLYDLTANQMRRVGGGTPTTRFDFLHDDTLAYSLGKSVEVRNLADGTTTRLSGMSDEVYSIAAHPSGTLIAVGDNAGGVSLFSPDGRLLSSVQGHTGKPAAAGGVWAVQFSPDGRSLATSDLSGQLIVWHVDDAATGTISEIARHRTSGAIYDLHFTPDGSALLVAAGRGAGVTLAAYAVPHIPLQHIDALFADTSGSTSPQPSVAATDAYFLGEMANTEAITMAGEALIDAARDEARTILEQEAALAAAALEAARSALNVDNGNLQAILSQSLWERSAFFINTQKAETLIRTTYADVFPANESAAIDAAFKANPGKSRGQHENQLHKRQSKTLTQWRGAIDNFSNTVGGNLRQAMQVLALRASGTQADRQSALKIQQICEKNLRIYGNPLRVLGVTTPSFTQLLNDAQRMMTQEQQMLARIGADQQTLWQQETHLGHIQDTLKTDAVSLSVLSTPDPHSRGQRAQRLIAHAVSQATDPRVRTVLALAQSPAQAPIVLSTLAQTFTYGTIDASALAAASSTALADAQKSDADLRAAAKTILSLKTPDALFQETQHWYLRSASVPGNLDTMLSPNSAAGRLVLGIAQRLWVEQDHVSRYAIAMEAEAVTGISSTALLQLQRTDAESFGRGIQRIFTHAGFGFLFDAQPMPAGTAMQAGAINNNGIVRVAWDVAAGPLQPLSVGLYLLHGDTGQQLQILTENVQHTLFADITPTPLQSSVQPTTHFAVRTVQYFAQTEQVGGKQVHKTVNAMTGGFEWVPGNTSRISIDGLPANATLINYLHEHVLPGLMKISDTEWRSPDIGAGDQCKIWIQENIIPAAFNGTITIPTNSKINLYEWNEGSDISMIRQIDVQSPTSEGLQQFFLHASIGDIVQMNWNTIPHTFVIDSVQQNGIWVFDSNWDERLDDETVRYHFISFDAFNVKMLQATIYRITPDAL